MTDGADKPGGRPDSRKVFAVVDVGCQHCDVDSEEVGLFWTREEAEAAAKKRNEETKCWRDSGQTCCWVFEFTLPEQP